METQCGKHGDKPTKNHDDPSDGVDDRVHEDGLSDWAGPEVVWPCCRKRAAETVAVKPTIARTTSVMR